MHPAAECAMAEILVSNSCDCRPPLLIGGFFIACGASRLGRSAGAQPDPGARLFSLLCALFFIVFPLFLRRRIF